MKNILVTVLIAIIVGAGGFFGGMKYQQSKQSTFTRQFGNRQGFNGTPGQGQNRMRQGGQVVGEIIAQDDKSITVKLSDNSSKIVLISATTTIGKMTAGSKIDLKVGERVGVFGTNNTDGSVTAQNIQLNPMVRGARTGGELPK